MPVGLLGLQTSTSRVRSVIAPAIASRSWDSSDRNGTRTEVAPEIWTMIGYASKDRQAKTTSSPGPATDCTICWQTPTDPVPTARCVAGTTNRSARRATSVDEAKSG